MKDFLLFLSFWMVIVETLAGQWRDDFSDGDFIQNPTWSGLTQHFIINPSFQLQLNATSAGNAWLGSDYQPNPREIIQWQAYIQMDFAPSSTNFGRWFLWTDHLPPDSALQSLYIQMGEAGSQDALTLIYKQGNTLTTLIRGTAGAISQAWKGSIRVQWDTLGVYRLWSDLDMDGVYVLEGTSAGTPPPPLSYTSIWATYTTSNVQKFIWDDFYIGPPILDTIKPQVDGIRWVSDQIIEVTFSERIDTQRSNPQITIELMEEGWRARLMSWSPTERSVHCEWPLPIFNGQRGHIIVSHVFDLGGNEIDSDTTPYFYYETKIPEPGELTISEFYPDPGNNTQLPPFEYVELFNRSRNFLQLQGCTFSDASGSATLQSLVLFPGEYVVLTPTSAPSLFNPDTKTLGVSGFPALNNGGDDIVIRCGGRTIDSISYTTAWYQDASKSGGGYSIEKLLMDYPCYDPKNWTASADPSGGTPGKMNSIRNTAPITSPPSIVSIEVISNQSLWIHFNMPLNRQSMGTSSYRVLPDDIQPMQQLWLSDQTVQLFFDVTFDSSRVYQLKVVGIPSCAGIIQPEIIIPWAIPVKAESKDVVFTEVMHRFVMGRQPYRSIPWVELWNRSSKAIDLKGFRFRDRTGEATLPSRLIFPDEYMILCHSNHVEFFKGYGSVMGLQSFPQPNQTSDDLYLLSPEGMQIDAVIYNENWHTDPVRKAGGYSLAFRDSTALCFPNQGWQSSGFQSGASPGMADTWVEDASYFQSGGMVWWPEFVSGHQAVFRFSPSPNPSAAADFATMLSTRPPLDSIHISCVSASCDQITLTWADSLNTGDSLVIEGYTIKDCKGENLPLIPRSWNLGLPSLALHGELRIREILYDPMPDGSSFVEIQNISSKWLDISQIILGRVRSGESSPTQLVSWMYMHDRPRILPPGALIAVTESKGKVCSMYDCPFPERVIELPSMISTTRDGGTFVLLNENLNVIDSVFANNKHHHPMLKQTRGISLERDEMGGWRSSTASIGYGSPGYLPDDMIPKTLNQDFQKPIKLRDWYFIPNQDGRKDALYIDYQFENLNPILSLHIINVEGRKIRTLAEAKLAGSHGMMVWDGWDDSHKLAPEGIYFVFGEWIHPDGTQGRIRLPFVLAGKL